MLAREIARRRRVRRLPPGARVLSSLVVSDVSDVVGTGIREYRFVLRWHSRSRDFAYCLFVCLFV